MQPAQPPLSAALFRHAAVLLGQMLAGPGANDKIAAEYWRSHPALGSRDRRWLADTAYGCLRQLALLRHIAGDPCHDHAEENAALLPACRSTANREQGPEAPAAPAETLLAIHLLTLGIQPDELAASGYRPGLPQHAADALAGRLQTLDPANLPLPVRCNLPGWILNALRTQLDEAEILELAVALNRPAPLDIRCNTLKTNRKRARQVLQEAGLEFSPTPWSPLGLRSPVRLPLQDSAAFTGGLIEIQDEGSQLLALLTDARRHQLVIDYCAGAGGKTLALGAMMGNTGSLYACDADARRLGRLVPRARRAGLKNLRSIVLDDSTHNPIRRLTGRADRVLVDAPCSGSGTLRRNPGSQWHPADIPGLTDLQAHILRQAAALVRPGGRLVYATCSLLPEENEHVVAEFLSTHTGFSLLPAGKILSRRRIALATENNVLRLWPHRHQTDGFFAAVLQRNQAG